MKSLPKEIIFKVLECLSDSEYIRIVETSEFGMYMRQRECFERFRRQITTKPKEYVDHDWFELLKQHSITKRPCQVCQQYFIKKGFPFEWNPKCNNLECSQYVKSGGFGSKKISSSYYEYGWF